MKCALALTLIFVSWTSSSRADEDWSKFRDCVRQNGDAVEKAEPSLFDGARLIVDVLCIQEATDLGNQMMRDPGRQGDIVDRGPGGAFGEFLGVMRRETTADLFKLRKERLGL